jgi:hypothetical protein
MVLNRRLPQTTARDVLPIVPFDMLPALQRADPPNTR